MIYYDPTEAMVTKHKDGSIKARSHIPSHFFDFAKPLKGLEHLTGADFIITPLDDPFPPIPAAIRKHCEAGAELIQRKSDNDLLSSLDDLAMIFARMAEWVEVPWLLAAGIGVGKGGQLKVEGQGTSGLWSRIDGALDAWGDKGGRVKQLPYNSLITEWVQRRERRIKSLLRDDEKVIARPHRQKVTVEKENWVHTLGAFPKGVGTKTTQAIARYLDKVGLPLTLSGVYQLVVTGELIRVPGIGKGTLEKIRSPYWWGVEEDQEVSIGQTITIDGETYIIERHNLGDPLPEGAIVPRKVKK